MRISKVEQTRLFIICFINQVPPYALANVNVANFAFSIYFIVDICII